MKNLRRYIIAAVCLVSLAVPGMAQDYYDDIYGSPKKQQKPKKQNTETPAPADYAPADSYAPSGSLQMDVDEYNRRGQFLVSDSVASDTTGIGDTFAYTRRIERYHNPEVVTESGDTTLCDYYYSTPQPANINLYVVDNTPYYPYGWTWRYGNPWYWNVYGPAYVGWCGWYDPFWYDPYPWGWSWGWSWGWTWAPGWGPGYGPGWGPSMAWRPSTPGAARPHNPTGSHGVNAGRRPAGGNHYAVNGSSRPGNMGRPSTGASYNHGVNYRPGSAGSAASATTARPGTRPNASQGTYTPYGAGSRGRGSSGVNSNSGNHNSRSNSNKNYDVNTNRNNNSSRSYNSGSSRSGFGSGGGSRSTRGGGGGRGTGGGGRGRR